MKPIKILHIIPGFGGGISSHVRNLISAVDPEQLKMDIIGFSGYPKEFEAEASEKGISLYQFPSVKKNGPIQVLAYLKKVISENQYDVVHCHSDGMRALLFSTVAKQCGVKRFILHAHRSADENDNRWYGKILYALDFISNHLAAKEYASCSRLASEHILGKRLLNANRIMHVPNGIRPERYMECLSESEFKRYKEEFGMGENTLVIGHIGRFNHQKNHEFIIKIAQALSQKGVEFKILLIGEGELLDKIKAKANEVKMTDSIVFAGRREDANRLYGIMDVMILPSLFEGLPTVGIESQAAGVPIIMADTISRETDLGMNLVKFLSIDDNAQDWAEAIMQMRKTNRIDAERRMDILNKKCFTAEKMAMLYEEFIYQKRRSYNFENVE